MNAEECRLREEREETRNLRVVGFIGHEPEQKEIEIPVYLRRVGADGEEEFVPNPHVGRRVPYNSSFFECPFCHATWSPNIQPGGGMPRNYRRCPNGCTAAVQK